MATEDLTPWLNKVKDASSRSTVLSILDQFRKLEWTDKQCAAMAKVYVRMMENLEDSGADKTTQTAEAASENDGPVWYEKM